MSNYRFNYKNNVELANKATDLNFDDDNDYCREVFLKPDSVCVYRKEQYLEKSDQTKTYYRLYLNPTVSQSNNISGHPSLSSTDLSCNYLVGNYSNDLILPLSKLSKTNPSLKESTAYKFLNEMGLSDDEIMEFSPENLDASFLGHKPEDAALKNFLPVDTLDKKAFFVKNPDFNFSGRFISSVEDTLMLSKDFNYDNEMANFIDKPHTSNLMLSESNNYLLELEDKTTGEKSYQLKINPVYMDDEIFKDSQNYSDTQIDSTRRASGRKYFNLSKPSITLDVSLDGEKFSESPIDNRFLENTGLGIAFKEELKNIDFEEEMVISDQNIGDLDNTIVKYKTLSGLDGFKFTANGFKDSIYHGKLTENTLKESNAFLNPTIEPNFDEINKLDIKKYNLLKNENTITSDFENIKGFQRFSTSDEVLNKLMSTNESAVANMGRNDYVQEAFIPEKGCTVWREKKFNKYDYYLNMDLNLSSINNFHGENNIIHENKITTDLNGSFGFKNGLNLALNPLDKEGDKDTSSNAYKVLTSLGVPDNVIDAFKPSSLEKVFDDFETTSNKKVDSFLDTSLDGTSFLLKNPKSSFYRGHIVKPDENILSSDTVDLDFEKKYQDMTKNVPYNCTIKSNTSYLLESANQKNGVTSYMLAVDPYLTESGISKKPLPFRTLEPEKGENSVSKGYNFIFIPLGSPDDGSLDKGLTKPFLKNSGLSDKLSLLLTSDDADNLFKDKKPKIANGFERRSMTFSELGLDSVSFGMSNLHSNFKKDLSSFYENYENRFSSKDDLLTREESLDLSKKVKNNEFTPPVSDLDKSEVFIPKNGAYIEQITDSNNEKKYVVGIAPAYSMDNPSNLRNSFYSKNVENGKIKPFISVPLDDSSGNSFKDLKDNITINDSANFVFDSKKLEEKFENIPNKGNSNSKFLKFEELEGSSFKVPKDNDVKNTFSNVKSNISPSPSFDMDSNSHKASLLVVANNSKKSSFSSEASTPARDKTAEFD